MLQHKVSMKKKARKWNRTWCAEVTEHVPRNLESCYLLKTRGISVATERDLGSKKFLKKMQFVSDFWG